MDKETLRMQLHAGLITESEYKQKLEEKQDLNENLVGLGAINNPFPTREKSDYELAFEHFTKGEVNEEMGETFQYSEWADAIHKFIQTNLSNDEKELYMVAKALDKVKTMINSEMGGEMDPDFHVDYPM